MDFDVVVFVGVFYLEYILICEAIYGNFLGFFWKKGMVIEFEFFFGFVVGIVSLDLGVAVFYVFNYK